MRKVVIAFDVDGTLIREKSDRKPVANERIRTLLVSLASFKNTEIVVWSGGGELYARQVANEIGISKYVNKYVDKEYTKCLKCKNFDDCNHHIFATKFKPDIAIDDIQSCTLGKLNLIVREK